MQALLTPGTVARDTLSSTLVSKASVLLVLSTDGGAVASAFAVSAVDGVVPYKIAIPRHCCASMWSSASFWRSHA